MAGVVKAAKAGGEDNRAEEKAHASAEQRGPDDDRRPDADEDCGEHGGSPSAHAAILPPATSTREGLAFSTYSTVRPKSGAPLRPRRRGAPTTTSSAFR